MLAIDVVRPCSRLQPVAIISWMTEGLSPYTRTLRPTEAQALEAWRAIVVAERQQVESLPGRAEFSDFYGPVAQRFRDDPRRTNDPSLDLVLAEVQPSETWLDLGAGAGRYALPISLKAGRVFAIEPSTGMGAALRESMAEEGIGNVDIFQERWPGPSAAPIADVGFISHVGYDIEDIGGFIGQLEEHSSRLCAALLFVASPTSDWAPLWRLVHGEPRVTLPGLREFTALLYARGRRPETRLVELPPRVYPTLNEMAESARRPLFVTPDSNADVRLRTACSQVGVLVDGGFALTETPRSVGIVTWKPR